MRLWRKSRSVIDLDQLPDEARTALESAISGREITLRRGSEDLGQLVFRPTVLEGDIVATFRLGQPKVDVPEGVKVVVTAMELSKSARAKLADSFGPDYLVLDLNDAPEDAEVLLTHPISLTLLGQLQVRFPTARVVVTEIEDEETGVSYSGPVSRLIDAGASAYLPPRTLSSLAATVDRYMKTNSVPGITAHSNDSSHPLGLEEAHKEIEE